MPLNKDCICNALVSIQAASRAAKREDRVRIEPGDGCGSRTCAPHGNHKPARFRWNQRRMAKRVWKGKGILIRMPDTRKDKTFYQIAGDRMVVTIRNTIIETFRGTGDRRKRKRKRKP